MYQRIQISKSNKTIANIGTVNYKKIHNVNGDNKTTRMFKNKLYLFTIYIQRAAGLYTLFFYIRVLQTRNVIF